MPVCVRRSDGDAILAMDDTVLDLGKAIRAGGTSGCRASSSDDGNPEPFSFDGPRTGDRGTETEDGGVGILRAI